MKLFQIFYQIQTWSWRRFTFGISTVSLAFIWVNIFHFSYQQPALVVSSQNKCIIFFVFKIVLKRTTNYKAKMYFQSCFANTKESLTYSHGPRYLAQLFQFMQTRIITPIIRYVLLLTCTLCPHHHIQVNLDQNYANFLNTCSSYHQLKIKLNILPKNMVVYCC